MANPITRVIKLILDKAAAAKAEADAKKSLSGIEGAFGKLKSAALSLGGVLATAFGIRALVRFATGAVNAAGIVEKAWTDLRGTIDATGASFDAMEEKLHAVGDAFQDATIHDSEEFAQGLTRMISLTGDAGKSLQNMGLAANVAAQFFGGDLQQGVELVAKVSQGLITPLQRMGIHAKSTGEALEILAKRSMGAAAREAGTFQGKMKQLNNTWDDFREELGAALIAGGEGASVLDTLKSAVQDLTKWVSENKDAIRLWVTTGINVAIGAMRTLLDLAKTFLQSQGKLSLNAGNAAFQPATTEKGIKAQQATIEKQRQDALARLKKAQQALSDAESAPFDPEQKAKAARQIAAMEALRLELQAVTDDLETIEHNADAASEALKKLGSPTGKGVLKGKPTVISEVAGTGSDTKDERGLEIAKTFDELSRAMATAEQKSRLFGAAFDLNKAQTDALSNALDKFLDLGMTAMDPFIVGLTERLKRLTDATADSSDEFEKTVAEMDAIGAVQSEFAQSASETAFNVDLLGESFDALGATAQALETALRALHAMGKDGTPLFQKYSAQLNQVRHAMELSQKQAEDYQTAVSNLSSLIVGALGGDLKEVAKAKAKENLLRAAEELAEGIVSSLNPFTATKAAGHFAAAAKFGAIAGGWAALGGSIGGGGASGGSGLASAQGASGAASQSAKPQQEVTIVLEGPGFDAMNPTVQRVVYGSMQQARERYGENAKISVVRRNK